MMGSGEIQTARPDPNGAAQVRDAGITVPPVPAQSAGVLIPLRDLEYMAKRVSESGLFGLGASQMLTLMLLCQADGLHPMHALRRYHIIEGRPSMRADAMQAEFLRLGGTIEWVESTAEKCEAVFTHPVHAPKGNRVVLTLVELVESGVAATVDQKTGQVVLKGNYRKFPRQMLRARVLSEGIRMTTPGVIVGIYTPEEVSDMEPVATYKAHCPQGALAPAYLPNPPGHSAPTPATQPARVDQPTANYLLHLGHRIGLDEETLASVLAKWGVERIADLTQAQAVEVVETFERALAEGTEAPPTVADAAGPVDPDPGSFDPFAPPVEPAPDSPDDDDESEHVIDSDAVRPDEAAAGPPRKKRKKKAAAAE